MCMICHVLWGLRNAGEVVWHVRRLEGGPRPGYNGIVASFRIPREIMRVSERARASNVLASGGLLQSEGENPLSVICARIYSPRSREFPSPC